MARDLMPKSGIVMPHIVITRDAAVVGVSTVDGKAGSIDLTATYAKITDVYKKTETYSQSQVDDLIDPIMQRALFKDDPYINNDVALRSGGANGITSIDLIKAATDNSIHIGDLAAGIQGVHLYSEGKIDIAYKDANGQDAVAALYSQRYRPATNELPFAVVGTYTTDSKGRTTGVTKDGNNSDIKKLNALTNITTTNVIFEKSPTVPDPVNPYDAVTKRYVDNNSGGGTGATLNGIMNYGVGKPLMHASRAFIPAYELPLDGQLVSRTDYPDLWAWAQTTTPITDAAWVADVSKRGAYSMGDGSTTFRLPDWNGVQKNGVNGFTGADSIPANFFRGGVSAADMTIKQNAAPNIVTEMTVNFPSYGYVNVRGNKSAVYSAGDGNVITALPAGTGNAPGWGNLTFFDASRANAAYGRNSTTEVYPNHVSGVWVVRASGGFIAANTSWSVLNGDATAPVNGITVKGGAVRSVYKVGTAEYGVAELKSSIATSSTGVRTVGAEVVVTDATSGTATSKTIKLGTVDGLTGGIIKSPVLITSNIVSIPGTVVNSGPLLQCEIRDQNGIVINSNIYTELNTGQYSQTTISNFDSGNEVKNQFWSFRSDGNAYANGSWVNSASDIRVKKDFKPIENPFGTMRKIKAGTWRMNTKNGEDRFGIGVLANGLYDDYPEAKLTNGDQELSDGTVIKDVLTVQSGDSGVLAAVHHEAILTLMDENEKLKSELSELKTLVQSLINK